MKFSETKIPGVFLLELEKRTDDRGYFARAWCAREFQEQGLNPRLVQINTALSHKAGTLRGIHYQEPPFAEAKLVRCLRGAIFDVAVDLRPESPTFTEWVACELTADNGRMLYVPEGCGHGYQTLVDETEMLYQTSEFYAPQAARGALWNDAQIGVRWPLAVSEMSEADRNWPPLSAASRRRAAP
jgi:dTDP-4-dehydrorhamnose 3,5-epimerase